MADFSQTMEGRNRRRSERERSRPPCHLPRREMLARRTTGTVSLDARFYVRWVSLLFDGRQLEVVSRGRLALPKHPRRPRLSWVTAFVHDQINLRHGEYSTFSSDRAHRAAAARVPC